LELTTGVTDGVVAWVDTTTFSYLVTEVIGVVGETAANERESETGA
jgi:hypothetical protein